MEGTKHLIPDLIMTLNGGAYEEAASITEQIKATGNAELIKQQIILIQYYKYEKEQKTFRYRILRRML